MIPESRTNLLARRPAANAQSSGLVCASMVQDLVGAITSGELTRNERLPSEREFAQKYGISVTAVRRGMEILVREGFLSRRQGSGTYVTGESTASAPVRADTILICRGVVHPPSHPYFGQIYPSLFSQLSELGLVVSEFNGPIPRYDPTHTEYTNIRAGQIPAFLSEHPEIAGAILHRVPDDIAASIQASGQPCVAIGAHAGIPSVDYDWNTEFARAIGLVLKAGARRVWALRSEAPDDDKDALRLARAMAPESNQAAVTIHRGPRSDIYTQTTYDACEATRAMLRTGGPAFDGIAIASDFHAQGVLDALSEAGATPDRCPIIVTMVNKESRIHSSLPFTALVADGAATGRAAAELLHRRITRRDQAPSAIRLSCTVEESNRGGR